MAAAMSPSAAMSAVSPMRARPEPVRRLLRPDWPSPTFCMGCTRSRGGWLRCERFSEPPLT